MSEPDVATRESATKRRGRKLERPLQKRRVEFEETLARTAGARSAEAGASLPRASLWGDAFHRFMKNKASVVAAIAFYIVKLTIGLRVSEEEEREGLDISAHGERAYTA